MESRSNLTYLPCKPVVMSLNPCCPHLPRTILADLLYELDSSVVCSPQSCKLFSVTALPGMCEQHNKKGDQSPLSIRTKIKREHHVQEMWFPVSTCAHIAVIHREHHKYKLCFHLRVQPQHFATKGSITLGEQQGQLCRHHVIVTRMNNKAMQMFKLLLAYHSIANTKWMGGIR